MLGVAGDAFAARLLEGVARQLGVSAQSIPLADVEPGFGEREFAVVALPYVKRL